MRQHLAAERGSAANVARQMSGLYGVVRAPRPMPSWADNPAHHPLPPWPAMITDPWFYASAALGTFLIGMSKSGFLPGIGALGVPLMALFISPVQAAAIQLPLLVATDWLGIWNYRRDYDWPNLRILLPAAVLGIVAGWATASSVGEAHVRVVVGVIGVVFALHYWQRGWRQVKAEAPIGPGWTRGLVWGGLASYTSFFAHAGAPPYAVYILPQRLPNAIYAGTTIMFFSGSTCSSCRLISCSAS